MPNAAKWSLPLLLVFSATLAGQDPETKPTPAPAAPPLVLPLTSLKPDATIAIGGERRIAVMSDGVWVSSRAAGTLTRVDAETNALGSPIPIGKEPCFSVLPAFKDLWIPLCGGPSLVRFSAPSATPVPATPPAEPVAPPDRTPRPPVVISLGLKHAGPVVMGASSIWMITNTAGTLARIDPDTNAIVAEIAVPAGPTALAFGDGAVWVTTSNHMLTRVNGDTNVVVEHLKVGRAPTAVAVGDGAVWVLNSGDGSVSRIDPKTNKVTTTIKTGVTGAGGSIAIGEGSVWLSAVGVPLTRLDPATNRMVQQFQGPGGGALAVGLKSLWISATSTAIWRVDPRRVEATRR